MLAFPTLIKRPDGTYSWSCDALFKLPPELTDNKSLRDYLKISRPGWSTHQHGYKNYAVQCDNGDLFIIPALIIDDERPKRKRFDDIRPSYGKSEIETYARQLVSFYEEQHRKTREDFNLLIHDLRRLSTAIYHSAQEAVDILSALEYLNNNIREARTKIENVIGAQTLLRIRTDVLDYSGTPGDIDVCAVPIYRRFDKVIKSMSSFASKKNIKLLKTGVSFGESMGPDAIEIVAYTIIDNAIKYSPYNNDITVGFKETEQDIRVSIQSVGPTILNEEVNYLFDRGFRGRTAMESGVPGSGVGLFLAKKLVNQFNGDISVSSIGSYEIDQILMSDITFSISVPKIRAARNSSRS